MNASARVAAGTLLLFLPADTILIATDFVFGSLWCRQSRVQDDGTAGPREAGGDLCEREIRGDPVAAGDVAARADAPVLDVCRSPRRRESQDQGSSGIVGDCERRG